MKILIIDDNIDFAKKIINETKSFFSSDNDTDSDSKNPQNLVYKNPSIMSQAREIESLTLPGIIEILKDHSDKDLKCLFLNAELKIGSAKHQDFLGIELLKFIRSSDELGDLQKVPVILYSFIDPGYLILRNPLNSIIYSKGTYFKRLPFIINKDETENSLQRVENIRDLNSYFKNEVVNSLTILDPLNSHSLANMWGPLRLLSGYINTEINLSDRNQFIEKENVSYAITRFHNQLKNSILLKSIVQINGHPLEITRNEITEDPLKELTKNKNILYIDDEHNNGWSDVLRIILFDNTDYDFNSWKNQIDNNIPNIILHNKKDEVIFRCYSEYEESDKHLSGIKTIDADSVAFLKTLGKEILPKSRKVNDFKNGIIDRYDLIIIDLRLTKDEKDNYNISELSGAKLVENIRKINPAIPILIFTASNKVWNYTKLVNDLGANAYWIKESAELRKADLRYSQENYIFLKNNIKKCLEYSHHYKYIWNKILWFRDHYDDIKIILKKYIIEGNKDDDCIFEKKFTEIINLLHYAFKLLVKKEYEYELNISKKNIFSEVLIILGKIQEIKLDKNPIHSADLKGRSSIININANLEYLIYCLRGISSHSNESILEFNDIIIAFVISLYLFEFPGDPDSLYFQGTQYAFDLKQNYNRCKILTSNFPNLYKEMINERFIGLNCLPKQKDKYEITLKSVSPGRTSQIKIDNLYTSYVNNDELSIKGIRIPGKFNIQITQALQDEIKFSII
jgi:hypothetical protein